MAPPKTLSPAKRITGPGTSGYQITSAPTQVVGGQEVVFTLSPPPAALQTPPVLDPNYGMQPINFDWQIAFGNNVVDAADISNDPVNAPGVFTWDTSDARPGVYDVQLSVTDSAQMPPPGGPLPPIEAPAVTVNVRPIASGDVIPVTMMRSAEPPTSDTALWVVIRNSSSNLQFNNYMNFVDTIMCNPSSLDSNLPAPPCGFLPLSQRRFLPFPNIDAYRVLKVATECFLMMNCGVYMTPQALQSLLNQSGYDINEDGSRLDQNTSGLPNQIVNWWKMYLAEGNQYLHRSPNPKDPTNDPQNLMIPYLALVRSRLSDLALKDDCSMGVKCYGILQRKLTNPCFIELIWSYWQEEGMLVQTLNAISRRFQNLRGAVDRDPLMRFDIDPLRRLNSLLWGYVQDEQHRLTVVRRAYEYSHEYGLALEGKAVRALRPSDSRSKFLEAFHNLLYLCTIFFKEDDDTTVVADGFPVLNALKEVHYILAAGAANQFGELPSTARQEMLIQQWLLARPEMREFLGGKIMVPYPEEWMDRVDNVKSMRGWTDVSVIYFRDLAVYGEQVVLSVRYGAWSITNNPAQAANWARYWRPEIQAYMHAYRAATGVDLTAEPVNSTLPSVLLLRRLATQRPVAR
jgi:hypothetical protein